jgi:quinol monooxygenase YgiN
MLIVSGRLHVAATARDDFLTGCREVVTHARTAPGCLDFALSPDLLDPTRINVYERWESDEALTAFRDSGPAPDQLVAIVDADVQKYRISAAEPA